MSNRTCWAGMALFGLLNMTDFAQTYALLTRTGGAVYEANPVAAAWLARTGFAGLAVFKAATVLVAVTAIIGIARRNRSVAAGVIGFGCAAQLFVTLGSRQAMADLDYVERARFSDPVIPKWVDDAYAAGVEDPYHTAAPQPAPPNAE